MRLLQANLRSINTSKHLVELVAQTHHVAVMLFQEVWSAKMNFRDYIQISKLRDNKGGGGVAIIC